LQRQLRAHVRDAWPLEFDALAEDMRARLAQPPYVAHVTGLRFDEQDLLFVALSSVFGDVVDPYGQSWSGLVRRLSPARDRFVRGVGVLSEALHTDGTDLPEPNDVTCLLCVRPDQNGGGRTRLLDIDAVRASIFPSLGAESVQVLTSEPVPWQIADEVGGGRVKAPVLTDRRLRWLRHAVASPVPAPVDRALAEFEAGLAAATEVIDFAMSSGSMLMVNNKRTLHARTAIPDRANSVRLVLRTKVRRHTYSDAWATAWRY
jgi:alpha-ketoglutarate-dependent taurine dioxygenase